MCPDAKNVKCVKMHNSVDLLLQIMEKMIIITAMFNNFDQDCAALLQSAILSFFSHMKVWIHTDIIWQNRNNHSNQFLEVTSLFCMCYTEETDLLQTWQLDWNTADVFWSLWLSVFVLVGMNLFISVCIRVWRGFRFVFTQDEKWNIFSHRWLLFCYSSSGFHL